MAESYDYETTDSEIEVSTDKGGKNQSKKGVEVKVDGPTDRKWTVQRPKSGRSWVKVDDPKGNPLSTDRPLSGPFTFPRLQKGLFKALTWLNSEKLKKYYFLAEIVIFEKKFEKYQGEFPGFNEFLLELNFALFPIMSIFVPNLQIKYRVNSKKIRVHPSYHFSSKMTIQA